MLHNSCLICQSFQLKILPKYKKDSLVKCKNCGFIFCHLIPTPSELIDYYSTHYGEHTYDSSITRLRYNEILDKVEKYRKTNNLLDIGCGNGYFLEEAKKRGWCVYGTEYTANTLGICEKKGVVMHKGELNTENYLAASFDVITSFEVLEHINNPQEELAKIYTLLKPGGCFYFTTPNFNSISRRILKDKWSIINYPEHLSYYTKNTSKKLLRSNGFKPILVTTTGIGLSRFNKTVFKSKEGYISATSTDEKIRQVVEKKPLIRLIKVILNLILNLFGLGDSLKGFVIKL